AVFCHSQGLCRYTDSFPTRRSSDLVEEGDLEGLLKAIDIVAQKSPRHLLHGHEPLTRLFNSAAMLADMKSHLAWLREQVLAAIRDRKSTRLNSSHEWISYAVFCLKQ